MLQRKVFLTNTMNWGYKKGVLERGNVQYLAPENIDYYYTHTNDEQLIQTFVIISYTSNSELSHTLANNQLKHYT